MYNNIIDEQRWQIAEEDEIEFGGVCKNLTMKERRILKEEKRKKKAREVLSLCEHGEVCMSVID